MIRFDGEIRDLSQGGLGVVDGPDGKVFFVGGTWPGDRGTFEITSQKKKYGFANLVSLSVLSPHRLPQNPCRHQGVEEGRCGGCPWIAFDYSDQLKRKDHLVRYALERAKILATETELKSIAPSQNSLGYRNRAQFKTNGDQLGFISYQNKTLVDVDECVVLNKNCSQQLRDLRAKLPQPAWKPRENFLWNFIEVNDEISLADRADLLNQRLPFRQGNHSQNEFMKTWLRDELSKVKGTHSAVELFCGAGNFTKVLANSEKVNDLVAAEISEEGVHDLEAMSLPKTKTLVWNLFKPSAWSRIKHLSPHPTLLFLDPPREGFEQLPGLVERFPSLEKILYVSCSLNTFARDAAALRGLGFKARQIQPVDMFPNTPHIELLAAFER